LVEKSGLVKTSDTDMIKFSGWVCDVREGFITTDGRTGWAMTMERRSRRFIPDGLAADQVLEQRLCMSVSRLQGGLPGMNQQQAGPQTIPGGGSTKNPWQIRRDLRIQRVPASFYEIDPTQIIPKPVTASIQANLAQLLGTLPSKTAPDLRQQMNQIIKAMVPYQGVSAQSAGAINKIFGELLLSAGANPTIVTSLQNDMTQVTQAAIQTSTQPSYAVTNNYIYMYFSATTVGWSIPTPGAPQLARAQNQNPNGDPVTSSRRPTFMGRYAPNMALEVLDVSNGNIIARGMVQPNGSFQARSLTVLNPGTYTLTARGVTPAGETSAFSPWTTLTITSAGPTGNRR
jgi:hypothetical protein